MGYPASNNKPIMYVHGVIMLALMIFFGKISPAEPLTELGMQVLGIFLGMVYGWIFVGMAVPSLVGLLFLGLSDYSTVDAIYKSAFGHSTFLLLMFVFAICGILDDAGLTKWISLKILTNKLAKGRPWVLTACVMLAAYVCAMFLTASATMVVIWSIIWGIAETCGYKKGDKWPTLAMVGVFLAPCMSCNVFPFKAMPASILGVMEGMYGFEVSYVPFFLWVNVVSLAVCAAYLLICKFAFRVDVEPLRKADIKMTEKLNDYQRAVLIWFTFYVIAMFLPGVLPKEWIVTTILKGLGNTGISALFLCIILFLNFKGGANNENHVMKAVKWNVILAIGAALTISSSFSSSETGIEAWIVHVATPILDGKGLFVLFFLVALLVAIVTQFCNNTGTAVMFAPIACTLVSAASTGGVDETAIKIMMLLVIQVCGIGVVFPSGSGTAAIMHSTKDWIPGNSAYFYGLLLMLLNFAVTVTLGVLLGNILPI